MAVAACDGAPDKVRANAYMKMSTRHPTMIRILVTVNAYEAIVATLEPGTANPASGLPVWAPNSKPAKPGTPRSTAREPSCFNTPGVTSLLAPRVASPMSACGVLILRHFKGLQGNEGNTDPP